MPNEYYSLWFKKLTKLLPGEKLLIPCDTVHLAREIKRIFERERSALSLVDPALANKIDFAILFQQGRHMVSAHVCEHAPVKGYIRKIGDFRPQPVDLETTYHRLAMIASLLLVYSLEEVEKKMGKLSEDELLYFGLLREKEKEEPGNDPISS